MGSEILLSFKIYLLAFVISMTVALLIRGIVLVVSRLQEAAPEPMRRGQERVPAVEDEIAAVAAAVYAVMGPYRIVHIQPQRRGSAWTAEGRYAHHASHTVPHHPRQTRK